MCSIQNFTADRWSSPNSLDYKLVLRSLFLLVKVRSCRDIPRHSQSFTHSILKTEDQQITLGSLVFDWDIKIEKSIDTTTPPQHDYHHRHCCNPRFRNLVKLQDMGKCRMKQQADLSPESLTASDIRSCTLVSYLVLQRSK